MVNFCHLEIPIIQAPMAGGITTPALVAAVSEAGGLGTLAGGYLAAQEVSTLVSKTKELTARPFGLNIFCPVPPQFSEIENQQKASSMLRKLQSLYAELNTNTPSLEEVMRQSSLKKQTQDFYEQIEIVISQKIPILSFTFGVPEKSIIEKLHQQGVCVVGTANTLEDAIALEKNNFDAIVVQGIEAGGHQGGFSMHISVNKKIKLAELLSQIIPRVRVPIIAAGGIGTSEQIKYFLKLGACAVQLGTAFLLSDESGISASYRAAILKSQKAGATELTSIVSGKDARGIVGKNLSALSLADLPDYPIQHYLTAPLRRVASQKGVFADTAFWVGSHVNQIADNPEIYQKSAGDIARYLWGF